MATTDTKATKNEWPKEELASCVSEKIIGWLLHVYIKAIEQLYFTLSNCSHVILKPYLIGSV